MVAAVAVIRTESHMPRSETPLRSDLFPEISPYASGMLAVDGRHTIYWEQSGNPEGVPVVFLHGGPGAGSAPVHRRLTDRNPDCHRPAARAWSRYEAACSTLYPTARAPFESDYGGFALALSRIEAHYFANGTFVPEGWPWSDLDRIRHLPCTIVQGRYDIVCPPVTADAVARAWPEARYVVVPDAGHSALEPGIRAALVNATESSRLSSSDVDLFAPRFPWET